MLLSLKDLFSYRELITTWTIRDFKVRYKQSVLGITWAILQPLSLMLVYSIVFSLFLKIDTGGIPYPLFSYVAVLPWTLFSNSLSFAIPSLVNNMNLVSKIYFPREILPLTSIFVCLIDFAFSSVVFVLMAIWYHVQISIGILYIPLVLLIQLLFSFGISLFASAMNVFYRDIRFIIPLALQIWMYLSPVIYPVSSVPEFIKPYYFLNPMAVFIESYRRIILYHQAPEWIYLGIAFLISLVIFIFSYRYFKKAERVFADII